MQITSLCAHILIATIYSMLLLCYSSYWLFPVFALQEQFSQHDSVINLCATPIQPIMKQKRITMARKSSGGAQNGDCSALDVLNNDTINETIFIEELRESRVEISQGARKSGEVSTYLSLLLVHATY